MAKTGENTQQITAEELETVLANAEAEKKAAVEAALKQAEEEKEAAVKAALAEYKAKTNTPSNENISKKDRMIPIKIEKNKNERDDVFVSVNGKNFQIKRGEKVEVPEYVVEVLENMKRMDELAIERMEEATKRFA